MAAALAVADSPEEEEGLRRLPGWSEFVQPVLEGGQRGAAYFPATVAGDSLIEILNPRGFEVHFMRPDDADEEVVHPAGQLFIPPRGWWRVWLEGEWSMSPHAKLTSLAVTRGTGWIPMPIVPAGRITVSGELSKKRTAGQGAELWALHAGGPAFGEPPRPMVQSRSLGSLGDGLLMPAGPTVAALRSGRDRRYEAITRPFDVVAGTARRAPLEVPDPSSAWMIAYAQLSQGLPTDSLSRLELAVVGSGQPIPPDVEIKADWGVYRLWYGLEPGEAVLQGGSDVLYLEPQTLDLLGGEIEVFEGKLLKRPILDVSLVLPSLVREKPFRLEVWKLPEGEKLAERELPRTAGRHRFQSGLVKSLVEVALVTHVGTFRQKVDLTAEEESFLGLQPDLIELHGTVRHGGEPHPAKLTFQTVGREAIEATADEHGEYLAIALQPLRRVSVALEGVDQEPWRDLYPFPIRHSRELSFDVPDAEVTVRVIDAMTGQGIAGARLGVRNDYRLSSEQGLEGGLEDARKRPTMSGESYRTGGTGVVRLPPPRPGRLEIHAHAEGYLRRKEPLILDVSDPPQDHEAEILLEPMGEALELRLLLPDGSVCSSRISPDFSPPLDIC